MSDGTARNHFQVTPSDTTAIQADGLFVGVAGTVTCLDRDGTSATYTAAAGNIIPVRVSKVMSTGTTASGIVGLLF